MEATSDRVARLRLAIERDLAVARDSFDRALHADGSNVFVWHDEEFWVDRVRRIAVPAAGITWRSSTTLPDDGELSDAKDFLEVYGGSARSEDTGSILKLFAWLMCGVERHHLWTPTAAHVLNLAVAQPIINPAFRSLFWLALAEDSGPSGHRSSFYDLVGPMIYAPYETESSPGAAEIRRAQVAFVEELFPGASGAGPDQLSDLQWAERCEQLLRSRQAFVDDHVFYEVLSRLGAVSGEPDARPFV
jgi:hypothetical protein